MKAALRFERGGAARPIAALASAIVLLAVGSCATRTVAPTPASSLTTATARPAAARRLADAPEVRDVRIARHGGDLDFAIVLVPGSEGERLPLDARPADGSSWTFRLRLDTDQSPWSGDWGGAEYELDLLPGNVLTLYRQSRAGSQAIATVPFHDEPGGVRFTLRAALLGDDDGWMDWMLDVYEVVVLGDEREYLLAATLRGTNHALPDASRQVPVVRELRTELRGDTLYVRGQLHPGDPAYRTFYDPYRAGGWSLQLFLNTDQARTGYWLGFDYIVRGVEWSPDGSFVVRRIAPTDAGWGPASGAARFEIRPRTFELAVPLAAIGGDDGLLDYALEQYATVECPPCEGGTTDIYVADTFGSTGPSGGRHALALGRLERAGLGPRAGVVDLGALARVTSASAACRMQVR